MALVFKRKVILFKVETTPGTDSVPAAATDAMLVRNFAITPISQDNDQRDFDINYVGDVGRIPGGARVDFSFEVEMAGSGAAGTAPAYAPLFKACGMSETISAGVSAVYAPINPGAESTGTLYFYLGGRLHKAVYCIGNVKAMLTRGKIPVWQFNFLSIYVTPTDVAIPVPTVTGFKKPLAVTNVNTTPVTLHGFSGKFSDISLDVGNSMLYRNLVGSESVRFVDRNSKGSIKLEDELVGTIDWWTKIRAGTLGSLSVQHGVAAGAIVLIVAPNVQLIDTKLDQQENISELMMNMVLQPSSAGNDEWSITIK